MRSFPLVALFFLSTLSGCCQSREANLRAAIAPYRLALQTHFATTGTCPAALEDLHIQLPSGLTQKGNELRGCGGYARYVRDGQTECSIVTGGISFCGVCRAQATGGAEQC